MILRMYSMCDGVAKQACPPFPARTDEQAVRIGMDFFRKNPTEPMADYSLFFVGTFDDVAVELEPYGPTLIPLTDTRQGELEM